MPDDETSREIPKTVVRQPDPMLDEQRPGPFRIALTLVGAAFVVVLVMYGLSRPTEEPTQTASAQQTSGQPSSSQAPQSQEQAGHGGTQPSTTGQGPRENQQQQTKQGQGKSPRSDSATSGQASAPSDKAAPPSNGK